MDVRIGITHSMREIEVDVDDSVSRDDLKAHIEESLADDDKVLWMADRKGREVFIPSGKVAYVEIGSPSESRRVGFTS